MSTRDDARSQDLPACFSALATSFCCCFSSFAAALSGFFAWPGGVACFFTWPGGIACVFGFGFGIGFGSCFGFTGAIVGAGVGCGFAGLAGLCAAGRCVVWCRCGVLARWETTVAAG